MTYITKYQKNFHWKIKNRTFSGAARFPPRLPVHIAPAGAPEDGRS